MTRSRFIFFVVSTVLVLPLLAGSLLGAASSADVAGDSLYKYLAVFTEAVGLVNQTYVEETDLDGLMSGALDGATEALDPFSVYVPETAIEPYLEARAIGTRHSGLLLLRERGMDYVVAVDAGSPAAAAGLQAGDLVTEIDGASTRTMPLWRLQRLLAGTAGTERHLDVLRRTETLEATLTLGPFEPAVVTAETRDGIGILRIPAFGATAAGQVETALARLAREGAGDLVVDLRGTAGGDPRAAYAVAGELVAGELGHLTNRAGRLETFTGHGPPAPGADTAAAANTANTADTAAAATARWPERILVLTDRSTLGPAEILAAILKDKLDAELFGQRTFGYAGRQTLIELPSGGRLLLTDAFYTGPDAEPLNQPLEPDVRIALSFQIADESDPDSDDLLDQALDHLRGDAETAQAAEKAAA